ncbi:MAG: hypothetical protein KAR56_04045 [Thermoplasmata archaeon]|nr:hypothetical protein [Thermoplasmata archaeon]
MKKPNLDIVNLVGITLIVVAIVSAGGLYYTASTWADISEAYATVNVEISGLDIIRDNSTGQVSVTAMFLIDNPSDLDIEIYRVESVANMAASATTVTDYDKYVGSGSVGNRNNTVPAGTIREVQVSMSINPNTTYMERFNLAELDGSVYVFLYGTVWYRIINFPDAIQRQDGISYMGSVVVRYG